MKKIIIIPTYNERENIKKLITKIIKLYKSEFHILVIDDNSPDKTAEEVKILKKKYNFVDCIIRKKKLGIGSAHKFGIKCAYKKNYSLIVTMDADGTHDPKYISNLITHSKKHDFITTNRFLKKNSLSDWPFPRKVLTILRQHLINFFLRLPIDSSGAFRCYDTKNIKLKDILNAKDNGYSFFWESAFILYRKKYSIHEVPIHLPYRSFGTSKMNLSDIFNAFIYLLIIFKRNL